jgi:hypothetical protein
MQGRFPRWVRAAFEQFAGFRSSPSYRGLACGALVYYEFVLRTAERAVIRTA